MEVAACAVVFAAIVEKVLQRTCKDHRITIVMTILCIVMLMVALAVALYEKISLIPVLLLL